MIARRYCFLTAAQCLQALAAAYPARVLRRAAAAAIPKSCLCRLVSYRQGRVPLGESMKERNSALAQGHWQQENELSTKAED